MKFEWLQVLPPQAESTINFTLLDTPQITILPTRTQAHQHEFDPTKVDEHKHRK